MFIGKGRGCQPNEEGDATLLMMVKFETKRGLAIDLVVDLWLLIFGLERWRQRQIQIQIYRNREKQEMSVPQKFTALPDPEEVFIPLSEEQLAILEAQVEAEQPVATVQSQFNFGWGLMKSNDTDDVKQGINLLTDIFKTVPTRRIECIYYLSLACFKIKEYREATRYIDALLMYEPENKQAVTLKKMIENELAKDSLIGFALVSTAIAATVGVASYFMKRHK